jgi:hypothetical protein
MRVRQKFCRCPAQVNQEAWLSWWVLAGEECGENAGGPGTRRGVPGPRPMQAARKPDSVLDDHSSRRRVTAALEQPTRKFRLVRPRAAEPELSAWAHRADTLVPAESAGAIPAYLVLLRVGFTMRRPLLAVRCALTAPFHPYPSITCVISGRYILCCTGRLCALKHKSRTLSGTLPCGVRTFLPLPMLAHGRQRSSSRLQA